MIQVRLNEIQHCGVCGNNRKDEGKFTHIQYATYNREVQKSGRRKNGSCSRDIDNGVVHCGGSLRHEDRAQQ